MKLVLLSHSLPVKCLLNWPAATSEVAAGHLLHVTHCCSILCALVGGTHTLEMHLMCRGGRVKAPGLQLPNGALAVLVEWRNANAPSDHLENFSGPTWQLDFRFKSLLKF